MKKTVLLFAIVILTVLAGCNRNSDALGKDIGKIANPASDFEYMESENGIIIYNYIGSDQNVIIPEEIEGKKVTQMYDAFRYNHTVVSVEIPDTVTELGHFAFAGCHSLTKVALPRNLKYINSNTFENCTKLSEISLPDSLILIGNDAFKNCISLKYIKIPKNVMYLGEESFLNSGVETIDFEDGIKNIGRDAFAYTDITKVILPKSVRKIESGAFSNCANLESVTLQEGLAEIEGSAFSGQSKLTEIIIPASVTQVSELAVYGCSTLQAVKFEGNAPEKYRYKGPIHIDRGSYTVYYHRDATGFTSPEWYRYPTKIW